MKLALFGFGPWGKNYYRTTYTIDDIKISAICKKSNNEFPTSILFGTNVTIPIECPITTNFDEAIRKADGVIISTPPEVRTEIALKCLDLGLPVLLEKPVALTLDECEKIVNKAEQKNLKLMVDYVHLFSPYFNELRRRASSWNLKIIKSDLGSNGPVRSYSSLLDWGPHNVAMVLSIMGRLPIGYEIDSEKISEGREIYRLNMDFGHFGDARLRFGNGYFENRRKFSVCCSEDVICYDGGHSGSLEYLNNKGIRINIEVEDQKTPLENVVRTFTDYIQTRDTSHVSFDSKFHLDVMKFLT